MILLETPRLRLRRLRDDDAENIFRLDSDPDVMRYIRDPSTTTRESAAESVARAIRFYESESHPGLGIWAMELKSTGDFIGWSCLKPLDTTPEIEVGYRLLKEHWANGYATEAARALVDYGFAERGLQRIVGVVRPDNRASARVLEKAGLRYEKDAFFYGTTVRYFARRRGGEEARNR
jgi:ribosomal-protein-alanine N-acetyltransferase